MRCIDPAGFCGERRGRSAAMLRNTSRDIATRGRAAEAKNVAEMKPATARAAGCQFAVAGATRRLPFE
ncbi:hypothetical protein WT56_04520 [Burkholderia pseudomultivorans]|uniref:Uncharacterized protein n=1 Tax=Burkholderia pseudomultivorans TaxID=1207504 RepID=A0A132EN44_9BURK|nr:hypothetical protein WT56_04520 [Burkholderia pseudomultivorans]